MSEGLGAKFPTDVKKNFFCCQGLIFWENKIVRYQQILRAYSIWGKKMARVAKKKKLKFGETTFPDLFLYPRPSNQFSRVDRVFLRHIAKKKIFRPPKKYFSFLQVLRALDFWSRPIFFPKKPGKNRKSEKPLFRPITDLKKIIFFL